MSWFQASLNNYGGLKLTLTKLDAYQGVSSRKEEKDAVKGGHPRQRERRRERNVKRRDPMVVKGRQRGWWQVGKRVKEKLWRRDEFEKREHNKTEGTKKERKRKKTWRRMEKHPDGGIWRQRGVYGVPYHLWCTVVPSSYFLSFFFSTNTSKIFLSNNINSSITIFLNVIKGNT